MNRSDDYYHYITITQINVDVFFVLLKFIFQWNSVDFTQLDLKVYMRI